jgi:competence protein ComEA
MELQEKLLPFIKEHGIALGLGMVGLICLGYGLVTLSQPKSEASDNAVLSTQEKVSTPRTFITPLPKQITIDIEGSVEKPGVYTVPANSRTQDALIAAGGLSQSADRQQVAQHLNLAAPLTDGAKLYIPALGEQMVASGNSSDSSTGVSGSGSKIVNINQATESDLDALPGVGPVTAQKIIDNRPYQSVQELLDKKVVGQSVYGKIKDEVTVY